MLFDYAPVNKKHDSLLSVFEELHNYIYANDGKSSEQVLSEMVKVLFMKILDEKQNLWLFKITPEEFSDIRNKKNNKDFLNRLNDLYLKVALKYKEEFDSADSIKLSLQSLSFVVNKLQFISLTESSSDSKWLAFQKFLSSNQKWDRGQFFTPEPIIDFCVKIINPKPWEKIIDPACWSWWFLFSSYKHIVENNKIKSIEDYIKNYVRWIDVNKEIARIARLKFLLEWGIENSFIHHNSLEDLDSISLVSWTNLKEQFDIVLTNPPFGTLWKIDNKRLLQTYDLWYKRNVADWLSYKTNVLQNAQVPEILFIERCLSLLKPGWRMWIVLPNWHFENSSLEYVRLYIKSKAHVTAIINLPQETFIPYWTWVKTSLLFIEKKSEANISPKIYFNKIKNVWYQWNKNWTPIYKKDKNWIDLISEDWNKILHEDFSKSIDDYKNFLISWSTNLDTSFSIEQSNLNGRFDYDYYSPEYKNMIEKIKKNWWVRLGDICEIVTKKSPKLNDKNLLVNYVELSDINVHGFEIINSSEMYVHELPSRASYELKEWDILTAVAGNSIWTKKHANALVSKSNAWDICTNGFRILRNCKIDKYYLLYYLSSDLFLNQVMMYRTWAAIPSISNEDLENIIVYVPEEKQLKGVSESIKSFFDMRHSAKLSLNKINSVFSSVR